MQPHEGNTIKMHQPQESEYKHHHNCHDSRAPTVSLLQHCDEAGDEPEEPQGPLSTKAISIGRPTSEV